MRSGRRDFLIVAAALGVGGAGGAAAVLKAAPPLRATRRKDETTVQTAAAAPQAEEEPNSPPEILMLEHAVEERLLLLYGEIADRLKAQEDNAARAALAQAAGFVRKFVEDCHEKIEEQLVFVLFENHPRLGPMVKTLKAQHEAGRALTDRILAGTGATPAARLDLAQWCEAFVRMQRPHTAREATDMFQTLYEIQSEQKLEEMSDAIETKEEELLGADGVARFIAQVADLEKQLGIHDLERFTPRS